MYPHGLYNVKVFTNGFHEMQKIAIIIKLLKQLNTFWTTWNAGFAFRHLSIWSDVVNNGDPQNISMCLMDKVLQFE